MVARTELTVLDHNSNMVRPQARTNDGTARYNIVFPKITKQWVAKLMRHDLARKAFQLWLSELSKEHKENILLPDDIPKNIADTEFQNRSINTMSEVTRSKLHEHIWDTDSNQYTFTNWIKHHQL